MSSPEWYEGWRHDAVHELIAKNAALHDRFRLGDWPRYHYALERRELVFSDPNGPKVRAEVQVIGTTGRRDWLWAWANPHWAPDLVKDAERVRAFGVEQGVEDLTTASLEGEDLNGLGWECLAVAARLLDAPGGYRPREDGAGLFLLYRSIDWIA